MTEYVRDKRSPIPASAAVSLNMRGNRSKNTKPEITLRKSLWKNGMRGYRLHEKLLPGRPDIVFRAKRIVIFVNGCFWHRCPKCSKTLPKSNQPFWIEKFNKNKDRDLKNIATLEGLGWRVLTMWECQIRKDISECINILERILK